MDCRWWQSGKVFKEENNQRKQMKCIYNLEGKNKAVVLFKFLAALLITYSHMKVLFLSMKVWLLVVLSATLCSSSVLDLRCSWDVRVILPTGTAEG